MYEQLPQDDFDTKEHKKCNNSKASSYKEGLIFSLVVKLIYRQLFWMEVRENKINRKCQTVSKYFLQQLDSKVCQVPYLLCVSHPSLLPQLCFATASPQISFIT